MDIFSVIALLGGLAFFLYGMTAMSDGLEKVSNGKLNHALSKVTDNRLMAMLCGAGITIAVQSSSAVTVMLVGLVNSGIIEFHQTIGVLMGSNIGTTLTAWLLSLAGIDSDVVWINLLKPVNFSPLFAFIGIILIMVGKKDKHKSLGSVLIGFAVLMFGMSLMSDAMKPLADMPEFAQLLTAFKNPILAVIVGALFTGIIQSSAASVAILQALSLTGSITYGMAIPIIMGQNIGTCVTAVLSSIGVSRNAKKVAVVHLSFNIIGTLVCLIPFCVGDLIFDWAFSDQAITPIAIAVSHSIFNVTTTFLLLPFVKQLEALANKIIPDIEEEEEHKIILDDRLLAVPSMAVEQAAEATAEMANLSKTAIFEAMDLFKTYSNEGFERVEKLETVSDGYQDQLGTYMIKLSKIGVGDQDSKRIAKLLHTIDDFERISDHAVNLAKAAQEIHEKQIVMSPNGRAELEVLTNAISEILEMTTTAFCTTDIDLATRVEPLEDVIDTLITKARRHHISRLQRGVCTVEHGFVLNDILQSYSRVSDHCSNIAVALIESRKGTFDTHVYLDSIKTTDNEEFRQLFDEYAEKYKFVKVS
ncbi:MAG: Na/Pi cotransporter family protein [Firmicutes bacterium]|nr:Na/Pi cotransporter family protein [Bacillota bacterium]